MPTPNDILVAAFINDGTGHAAQVIRVLAYPIASVTA